MSNISIGLVIALLTISHYGVYLYGKNTVYNRLSEDRVSILKDGADVDLQVYQAGDDRLCQLLGGCLPKSD